MASPAISCSTRGSTSSGAALVPDDRSATRKTWRLPNLLCLPEMTPIVRGNHEQSCRDAEPNQRNERIAEPRAGRVNRGGVGDQLADAIVCGPVLIENDLPFLPGSRNTLTRRP